MGKVPRNGSPCAVAPVTGYGEFDATLRAAIANRGLSLDELSQRLRERRTPVSASTLSYWQSGENQPERSTSLAAVPVLEELLELPAGALMQLVGPRRSRRRATPRDRRMVAAEDVWQRPETVARALAKIGATPEDLHFPIKVSQHVSYRVDESGFEESVRVRRLMLADRDTQTFLFVSRCTTLPQPPVLTYADGCRMSRFRADVPTSTCVFEFVLDRPLRAGELAAVEFGLRYPPGQAARHAQIAIFSPTRTLVVEVLFDPRRLPTRCYAYRQPRNTMPAQEQISLARGERRLQYITLDPSPGQYGIAWEWATPATR